MSNRNIHQIRDFLDLKNIVSANLTVVIGMTCPASTASSKVMIKKFLKRKAELYPLIQFVYMDLTAEQIKTTKLEIVVKDYDAYPLIYHIRDGNKILCTVTGATDDLAYGSFNELSQYYKKDMEEFNRKVQSVKSDKAGKSNKADKGSKSKIMLNLENVDSDSDSDASIETGKKESESFADGTHGTDEKSDTKTNTQANANANANTDLDPAQRMAIEREKMYAIETEYNKMQKKIIDEVRNRIKIERAEEKDDNDHKAGKAGKAGKADRADKADKSKNKTDSNKQTAYHAPTRPSHDSIGTAKTDASAQSKQNRNKRR